MGTTWTHGNLVLLPVAVTHGSLHVFYRREPFTILEKNLLKLFTQQEKDLGFKSTKL